MNQRNEQIIFMLAIVFVITGLLVLNFNQLEKGAVIEKSYREAHSSVEMKPYSGGDMHPQLVHHPERWSVTISDHTDSRSCRVSQIEWDKIEIGDWFECK